MKKYSVVFVLLLSIFIAQAQEIQGKAEYLVKYITHSEEFGSDKKEKSDIDVEFIRLTKEAMEKGSQARFFLSFNKYECLYEEEEILKNPTANPDEMTISVNYSDGGKKYLNSKEKKKITERDISGKEFLVVDKLESLNWKLINETKKIGDYVCLKAEIVIPVSEKEKKQYEEYLKQQEIKASVLFKMKEPKEKVVIAWYTPEIPVSFGPNNYYGLPGLILEIQSEEMIILCSKVTLSNKATFKIKAPNTGNKVTQVEFDETEKKMYERERREYNNSNRR